MSTSNIAVILACLVITGCGANPTRTADAGLPEAAETQARVEHEKDKRANCEKYTPIGSNRPKYRCLSATEKKAEAESNEREMRKVTAPAPGGGIGH